MHQRIQHINDSKHFIQRKFFCLFENGFNVPTYLQRKICNLPDLTYKFKKLQPGMLMYNVELDP